MLHAREDYQRIQDPLNKIGEDEPVMLFRAQDKHFKAVLLFYMSLVESNDVAQLVSQHVRKAIEWQKSHPIKEPDL